MVPATETATLEHGIEGFDTSIGYSTGELVLRVCSPARRGQIVRIRSRKCTIGSARSCTLRLNARGVQPLHCLVMRGPGATVIRCWTPDTRINGRSFTDANLNVGDHLTIGPIEFEVLNTNPSNIGVSQNGTLPETATQFDEDRAGFLEDKDRWERDRDSQIAELDQQCEQWQVERDSQQQRLRQEGKQLEAQAETLRQQRGQLGEQAKTLRQDREQLGEQAETLRQDREQLGEQAETLRQDREQLGKQTKTLRQDREQLGEQTKTLKQDHEQLGEQTKTLKQDHEQLGEQTKTLKQDHEQLGKQAETLKRDHEQLGEQAETLKRDREQLGEQAETLKRDHEQLGEQAETLKRDHEQLGEQAETLKRDREQLGEQAETLKRDREQLGEQAETLKRDREQLGEQAETLKQQREQWDASLGQDQSQSSQDNSLLEQEQRDLESKQAEFERLILQWRDERESEQQQLKQASEDIDRREASLLDQRMELDEARAALETKQQNEWDQGAADGVEESLDSYMARLMDRVHGMSGSDDTSVAAKQSEPSPPSSAKLPSAVPAAATTQATFAQSTESTSAQTANNTKRAPEKLKNFSPRGMAPEREMSLSSMRELANVSAQTAINRHAKRQFRHVARSKLLVAGIGLVSGGILMYLWWFMGDRGPIFYAGLVAFLVALFWGFQFAVMSGKVSATNTNTKRLVKMMSNDEGQSESNDQEATVDLADSADKPLQTAADVVEPQDEQ